MTWFVTGARRLSISSAFASDLVTGADWGQRVANRAVIPFLVSATIAAALVGILVPAFGIYIIFGLLGLVFAVASYLRPQVGLFLFGFMMYGRVSENITFTFGVPSVAPLLAVFLLTGLTARDGIGALWRTRLVYWIPLFVYGIVQLASVFVATDQSTVIDMVIIYAKEMIFIAVVVLYARRQADVRVFTWALLLAGVAASLITIYQNLSGTDFQFFGFGQTSAQIIVPGELEAVPRPSGYVGDPNFFALSLLPLIPLAAYRGSREQGLWLRVVGWLSVLALSTAIIMTYSRGAYIALAVVIVGLVWCGFVRARTLIAGAIVFLLLLPILPSNYSGRFTSMINATTTVLGDDTPKAHVTKDSSVDSRIGEVTSGLHMFLDHPILGVGLHNYPVRFQEYVRPLGTKWRIARSPHSLYIEIAAETGLMGLASFGALTVALFWWLRRVWTSAAQSPELRDFARALALGLLSYFIASVFLHASYPRFLWMLVAGVFVAHGLAWEREHRRTFARLDTVRAVPAISPVQRQRVRLVLGGVALLLIGFVSILQMDSSLSQRGVALLPRSAHAESRFAPEDFAIMTDPQTDSTPATSTETPIADIPPVASTLRAAAVAATPQTGCDFDEATQHNVCAPFQLFVVSNGGPAVFGSPLTEAFESGALRVQYFENARIESPVGDDGSGAVQMSRLGEAALERVTGELVVPPEEALRESGCVFEDATQHNVCGAFAFFWLSHGGLEVIGLPLSTETVEGDVRVQYFEYMRLEMSVDADPLDHVSVQFSALGASEFSVILEAQP